MSLPPTTSCRSSLPRLWMQFLAAVPVVVVATIMLCQTIEMVLAARLLERAARAAAMVATLPDADTASIQAAIHRTLAGSDLQGCVERPIIWIDGQPAAVGDLGGRGSGAAIAVSISAHVTDVVPDLLAPLGMSLAGKRLLANQVCRKP